MTTASLASLNLRANPFQDFELFEETLDERTIDEHKALFKNRIEIIQKLFLGITTSTSYKVVLHGEVGAGKSSLLNRVLHDVRKARYFAIKYRLSEASAKDVQMFERELLKTFGEEITRETSRNRSFRNFLESIIKSGTKRDLKQLSVIAMLYSSGQITIKEGKVETDGLSATIGIPILKADISGEEQKYIEVTRVETLSHMVFERLLKDGISLLKELGYKGVVIAIDEIDKLEDKLEARILTLIKDTFYPTALCHLLLVMKTRDGRKMIHPDIFFYEPIHPLAKRYVFEFLEELYMLEAIDRNKKLTSIIQKKLIDQIYENNNGSVRSILKDLYACVITAIMLSKTYLDDEVFRRTRATDALHAYVKALRPSEPEYKILSYLLRERETYSRDEELSKQTDLAKSALSSKLRLLLARNILISRRKGKKLILSIDPNARAMVESIIA